MPSSLAASEIVLFSETATIYRSDLKSTIFSGMTSPKSGFDQGR
jgi:hypothetical protein